jgi:NTE family protein
MHTGFLPQRSMDGPPTACLALQGGGALGAFTWGVLDALLQREVDIEAISGASAGAVNAVLLADGLLEGGPARAREKLGQFWRRLSDSMPAGGSSAAAATLNALDLLSMKPSPALLNPFGVNPLRELLRDAVDFDRLRRAQPIGLFIAATRVNDGRARIFQAHEVTLEAVLASACLPQLHEAVEIDGEAYWDGGYSANPPIMELVQATAAPHLLVVELTTAQPSSRAPGGKQIEQRLREFALGAALQRELDTLLDLQRMCRSERAAGSSLAVRLRDLRVRRVSAQAAFPRGLNPLDLSWSGLSRLADKGAAAGEAWAQEAVLPDAPLAAALPARHQPRAG